MYILTQCKPAGLLKYKHSRFERMGDCLHQPFSSPCMHCLTQRSIRGCDLLPNRNGTNSTLLVCCKRRGNAEGSNGQSVHKGQKYSIGALIGYSLFKSVWSRIVVPSLKFALLFFIIVFQMLSIFFIDANQSICSTWGMLHLTTRLPFDKQVCLIPHSFCCCSSFFLLQHANQLEDWSSQQYRVFVSRWSARFSY